MDFGVKADSTCVELNSMKVETDPLKFVNRLSKKSNGIVDLITNQ